MRANNFCVLTTKLTYCDDLVPENAFIPLSSSGCCLYYRVGSVIIDSLFIVDPIVCGGSEFDPHLAMQYLVSFLVL